MELTDNDTLVDLLTRAKTGDEGAFERLLEMYKPMMNSAIRRFSLDSRDTFSEACMGLYRAVSSYEVGQSDVTFGLYAKICVERSLIDMQRREKNSASNFVDNEIDVDKIAVAGGIESMLEHREQTARFLAVAKEVLSSFELDVYRYWMLGYKTSEISSALGVTAKTVDNAKNRMWRKLRERLEREF